MDITKEELIEKIKDLAGLSNEEKSEIIGSLRKTKKFGLVWEDRPEEVQEKLREFIPLLKEDESKRIISEEKNAPNHVLIEADNLEALTSLAYSHDGAFDVIYIDPPYNTGAKNWIYNNDYVDKDDSYRHSKWISMMNRRLKIARNLLKSDGVLILAIDENELATIKLLLEEIFGISYEIDCIAIVQNPRGIQGKNFSYTNEFAIFVIPKGDKIIGNRKLSENEVDWSPLRNWGGESLREDAKNCFYPIFIDGSKIVGFGDVCDDTFHPSKNEIMENGIIAVYPIVDGVEHKWRYARQSVESIIDSLRVKRSRNIYDIEIGKQYASYKTVWTDSRYDANTYGKKLLNTILPKCPFDFPKSIYNVYDCLYAVVAEKKDAKILDFFAGSGTTMHATMLLNANDGGKRQCILATNNENNICEDVTYERNKVVINGYKDSRGEEVAGLKRNNLRYYTINYVSREGSHQSKREQAYAMADLICVKEGAYAEQKTFGTLSLTGKERMIRYFAENDTRVLMIYDTRVIPYIVKEIDNMDAENIKIYIFADGSYPYTADFERVISKVTLVPMPYAMNKALKNVLPAQIDQELNDEPDNEEEE